MFRLIASVAAVAALALPGSAQAETGQSLSYSKSTSMNSNATDTVDGQPRPATLLRLQNQRFTVRSVPLGTIRAGEAIKALSEVEVTNDLVTKDADGNNVFHDVAVEAVLIIAGSPTATSGTEIAEAQGTFVTPQVHHWTIEKSGTYKATQDYSNRYLNLVMWASTRETLTQCWTFPRSGYPDPQEPRDCGVDVYYPRGHLSVLRSGPAASVPAGTPFTVEPFSGPSLPEASPSEAPITYGGQAPQFFVAMSRPVGTLNQGDILTAHSELQADARDVVRSNVNCNVMLATRLYLSPSPNSLSGAVGIGTEGGYNFTGRGSRQVKTLEQGVVPSSTTYKLPRSYTTPMYVVLRAWSLGNSACATYGNGIRVKLDQANSFMEVMRYRPAQQPSLVADTYNSGNSSERARTLDAATGTPVTVYSRKLTGLAPGQLIEALAEMEVDTSYERAGIHTTFVLANSASATTGTPLQADNFTELNPYMASLPIHDSTSWVVPSGISGSRYLNLVAYAQHLQALPSAPNNSVAIAPDDGRLVVQRFRPPVP